MQRALPSEREQTERATKAFPERARRRRIYEGKGLPAAEVVGLKTKPNQNETKRNEKAKMDDPWAPSGAGINGGEKLFG